MAQASRTQHLTEQDAFKGTLGLEPSIVIINAATFAEPENSSGSKKTRHIGICSHRGKRLLWPPPVHFLEQVPADSRQFSSPGLVLVLFGHLSALRDLTPGRHFLLGHLNCVLLLLWFSSSHCAASVSMLSLLIPYALWTCHGTFLPLLSSRSMLH